MIAVETVTDVGQDRTVRVELPETVKPGPHRMILVIEESALTGVNERDRRSPLALRKLAMPGWPQDSTFRREELYGDAGR